VSDILRVKFWQGSFDAPYRPVDAAAVDGNIRTAEALALADQAARETIILLKNDGATLPLRQEVRRILVAGPLADDDRAWFSRYGPQRLEFITPLAGIRAKLGAGAEVRYEWGVAAADGNFPESDVLKEPPSAGVQAGIDAAVAAAADVDVIIACLGETGELCRESHSRTSLNLPGYQEELLRALHGTGKPVVLVLSNGRPLAVNWAAKHVPAIVEMWFGSEQGGVALADVLFGDYNPAGRLPVTVPKTVGQVPFNFPAKPGAQAQDFGMVDGPLYPFGHGLSYTTFTYANLRISPERAKVGDDISVAIDVTNAGGRAGDEVVQLYVRDDYSSVTTPDQNLRGFERIHLAPGETRTVSFTLAPEHLHLFNAAQQWVVEPGRFTVMLGASSADLRARGTFVLSSPDGTVPEETPVP
jgi:beta-glucosidase